MSNFLISVISGIAVSLLLKWLEYVFMKSEAGDKNINISKGYISNVKKQFYFCFPVAIALITWRFFTPAESFLATIQISTAALMLMLSLFAFMCSIEVINALSEQKPDKKTDNNI